MFSLLKTTKVTRICLVFWVFLQMSMCTEVMNKGPELQYQKTYLNPYYYQWMEIDPYYLSSSKGMPNFRKKEVGPLKIFKYLNALKVKDLDHDGSDVHGELVHNTPLYEAYDSNLKLSRELNFGDFMRLKQQRDDDELHNKESKRFQQKEQRKRAGKKQLIKVLRL